MNKLYFQITKNKHHQLSMEVNQTNAHTEDNTPKDETEDNTPKVETEDNTPKVETEDSTPKFNIPKGREMTEEERKFLSDSLPF